jgi:cytochrome P450
VLPAGTRLLAGITMVQRAEENYAEALAFRPERFLDGDPPAYTWIPYGGGPRRCLGARLAQDQMRRIVATVAQRFDMEPARDRPEEGRVRGVTMIPDDGARVICRLRRS